MKTVSAAFVILLLLSGANVAQDVPLDDNKVDNVHLLTHYLKADGEERDALRKRLIALATPQLQAAIAGLKFEKPKAAGVSKHYTKCPDGHERPYWLHIPEGYDAGKPYPMMILLHGGVNAWPAEFPAGDDEAGVHRTAPGQYMVELYRDSMPASVREQVILLGASAGVPQTGAKAAWWHETGQRNVLHMMREAKRHLNVDDDKVVVSGISDGGSGSFGFAFRMNDSFAGYYSMIGHPLVPMADGSPVWFENLNQASIYAFNGGKDTLYPAAAVKKLIDDAENAGIYIFINEYPDLAHEVQPVIQRDMAYFFEKRWPTWKRDVFQHLLDWTCTTPARGECNWLKVTEIMDLGTRSADLPNYKFEIPAPRVRLGVTLVRDSAPPKVESVQEGSLAARMEIKAGDAIVKIGDAEIKTFEDLADALAAKSAGEDVSVVVQRGDEQLTRKGSFDAAKPPEPEPLAARVRGFYSEKYKGSVMVTVRNVGKLKVRVHPQMLSGERFTVEIRSGLTEIRSAHFDDLSPDNAYILDHFEKTGDRKWPYIREVEVDVAALLGARGSGDAPQEG